MHFVLMKLILYLAHIRSDPLAEIQLFLSVFKPITWLFKYTSLQNEVKKKKQTQTKIFNLLQETRDSGPNVTSCISNVQAINKNTDVQEQLERAIYDRGKKKVPWYLLRKLHPLVPTQKCTIFDNISGQ